MVNQHTGLAMVVRPVLHYWHVVALASDEVSSKALR